MTEKQFDEKRIIPIKCSSCNKKLINILCIDASDRTSFIQANCPFCGGGSLVEKIIGNMSFGPIPEEESISPTTIEDVEFDSESRKATFKIKKRKIQ